MIGERYWSTGISLRWHGGEEDQQAWGVSLEFFDGGFCQKDATEGNLHVRYRVARPELARAIDTLLKDANKLGIVFRDPTVYIPGDGEWKEPYHPEWRRIVAEQCARLHWRFIYNKEKNK